MAMPSRTTASLLGCSFAVATLCGLASGQTIVYVDAAAQAGGDGHSWASAFNNLQAGLAQARASLAVREVRVAQGVYRPGPPGDRQVSFQLPDGIAVRGGYAGVTGEDPNARDLRATPSILSGDLAGDDIAGGGGGNRSDNVFHVVTATGLVYPSVLDGFHVTGGRANGTGPGEAQGGGMYVDQCGDGLVLSRCTVRDNDANIGGGVMILDTSVAVSQCVIAGNRAFGWPGLRAEGLRLPRVPSLEHCTVAFNLSTSSACAGVSALVVGPNPEPESDIDIVPVYMPLHACIGTGNRSVGYFDYPQQFAGFVTATECLSTDGLGWNDQENVTGEPVFADAAGPDGVVGTLDDDMRLRPGSLGIDTGGPAGRDWADVNGDGATADDASVDVDGAVRVYGEASDIGAAEGPVLTVVTGEALVIGEGGSTPFVVKLTRSPGRSVTVSISAVAAGGTAPAASPEFVVLDDDNWSAGVAVTISWPTDAGVTDDTTDLVMTGPGIAAARQPVNQVDSTTPPGVIYVNPGATLPADGASWASAYRTIEAALDVARAFPQIQQVWVRSGTYRPPLPTGVTNQNLRSYNVRPGLKVIGGFAGNETSPSQRDLLTNQTVITGDNLGNDGPQLTNYGDNCNTLFTCINPAAGTELDGLHITHAKIAAVSSTSESFGDSQLNVRNCRFALNQGASVLKGSCNSVSGVYDCVFEDCGTPFSSNWALYISLNSTVGPDDLVEVHRCVFRRLNGGSGAGALFFGGPRVNVTDCSFTNVSGGGGTAWLELHGTPEVGVLATVTGCSLIDNSSGLTIRADSSWMTTVLTSQISDCTFRNNSVGLTPTPVAAIVNCLFENNIGGGGGTGIGYRNCVFRGNRATRGGAGPSGAEGCLFENNTATQRGGACQDGGTFVRCTFRNNSARVGGAIGSAQRLEECVFEGNHATNGSGGAAESCELAVSCVFAGNTASEDGGAGQIARAIGCRFVGNSAGGRGGAVYAATQIVNSLFTGNTAGDSGGAVYRVYRMLGCTVYGNHASAAGGLDVPLAGFEPTCVANSILWGNTATTGTLEEQQIRTPLRFNWPHYEIMSGSGATLGAVWGGGSQVLGPSSGGFSPGALSGALASSFGPPFTSTFACATPPGGLDAMVPARSEPEKWISVLSPSEGVMPSSLIRLGNALPPKAYSRAEWRFSFASDATVGDEVSPGLYLGTTPVPGTTGGVLGEQTDWLLDVSDITQPGVQKLPVIYLRNDSGFAGIRFRSDITYYVVPVAFCTVQGLAVHAGEGNSSADPQLAVIAGPDGQVGTTDDDPTPLLSSPVIDSGNSRMIGIDEGDIDQDGDTVEPLLADFDGNARVVDCPVDDTSVGARGPVDRGAIEVLPFQPLMAPPCVPDIGQAGGRYGHDGLLNNNDFIAFIDAFFISSPVADMGAAGGVAGRDGRWDNNDFIAFIGLFFAGC